MNKLGFRIIFSHPLFHAAIAFVLAACVVFWVSGEKYPTAPWMAGIVVIMAVFWLLEILPIPVTSLFPLFLFPALGITNMESTAGSYGKPEIFLFLGGFLLAIGLQKSGVHRRIALSIVKAVGSKPSSLVLGLIPGY